MTVPLKVRKIFFSSNLFEKIQTMEKLLFFAFSIALHQKNYRFNLCLLQNKDLIKVRIAGSKNLIASTQKQPPELFYDR